MPATNTNTFSASTSMTEHTCTTCLVNFNNKETKRSHMRAEWHVYNLKRRIALLAPISVTIFQNQISNSHTGNEELDSFQQSCPICQLHYTNRKAWHAHLKSRTHIQNLGSKLLFEREEDSSMINTSSNIEDEAQADDEEQQFNPHNCLFCAFVSSSLDSNLVHMSNAHSFFIPDIEYLIDTESFLSYLFTVISVFHECLCCGKSKNSKVGVWDHMRGKGHCKVDFENEVLGLEGFWDFEGVEGEGEELGEQCVGLLVDEDEMRLRSGKILGHRSHARHFRQRKLSSHSQPSESSQKLMISKNSEPDTVHLEIKDRRIVPRPRTDTSLMGLPEVEKRALIAVERKMAMVEGTKRNKYQSGVERGGNRQRRYKVGGIGKKQGGLEKRLG